MGQKSVFHFSFRQLAHLFSEHSGVKFDRASEIGYWNIRPAKCVGGHKVILHFLSMTFRIVFVGLSFFFISRRLMRSIAERLIFGEPAHANPNRLLLWLDFEGPLVGLNDPTHD